MRRRTARALAFTLALAFALSALAAGSPAASHVQRRGRRAPQYGRICPDPTAACPTGEMTFQPYDLPFRLPKNAVIYESEEFYAVVLKSVGVATEDDCEKFVPEEDRLAAQQLFPRRKVFTSRCPEPGTLYYTNVAPRQRLMAVHAGATRAEAARVLAEVKATGKFPGANLRRMRAGLNGT